MKYTITQGSIAKGGGGLAALWIMWTAFIYLLVPKHNNVGVSYNIALFPLIVTPKLGLVWLLDSAGMSSSSL